MLPQLRQSEQVVEVWKRMFVSRLAVTLRPVPLQVAHRRGDVPGLAPDPLQSGHACGFRHEFTNFQLICLILGGANIVAWIVGYGLKAQ